MQAAGAGSLRRRPARRASPIVTPRVRLLVVLVLAVMALLSAVIPHFLSANSLLNVARQATVPVIVASGMTFVITAGEFDLSVGSVVAVASVLLAWVSRQGYSVPVMVLSALAAGVAFGIINGFLVIRLRVPSFLATLGTLLVARGLAMTISLDPVPLHSLSFIRFFRGSPAGVPMPILVALLALALAVVLFDLSRFGVHTRAVGSHEGSARLAGLNAARQKYAVLLVSALFAAIGGVVLAGRTDYGMAQAGNGLELEVIAAVILGGARLGGGVGNVVGSALGAILFTMVFMGIAMAGLPGPYQDIAKGAAIGVAILLMRR